MAPPETEPEMDWDVRRDARAMQRIVALLLALAGLAERAAAMPSAPRALVLAILRHAEAVAWAFALGTLCVSTGPARDHGQVRNAALPAAPLSGQDGPEDAVRMASGLRLLALVFAGWATEALSPAAVEPPARCARTLKSPDSTGGWRGPAALPAPDTS